MIIEQEEKEEKKNKKKGDEREQKRWLKQKINNKRVDLNSDKNVITFKLKEINILNKFWSVPD